jgi:acyl-CoA hydrolase
MRIVSPEIAAKAVEPGMTVRFPTGHNPGILGDALAARVGELEDIEMVLCASVMDYAWLGSGFESTFSVTHEHWAGMHVRDAMRSRRHDYVPMPFSLRFKAMRDQRPVAEWRKMNVVCVQTTPPNRDGMVNLGPYPWDAPEFMRNADIVLAEMVPNLVELAGDSYVPAELVTYFVEAEPVPLYSGSPPTKASDATMAIARNVASLIKDGDCLQIGVGTATYAIIPHLTALLRDRNELGWHSEATLPGALALMKEGVIDSKRIPSHPGVSVAAGWHLLEDDRAFAERNNRVQGREIWKVVDPRTIAEIPNFKAINTATMMDLTGQVGAESVGTEMHSGTGGLLELTMGALWSPGGRSILVLPAIESKRHGSRIVPIMPEGTQVTVPRTLADTVVTEYGIATLFGKSARERADALIEVAAPEFRDELRHASRRLFYP